MLYHSSHNSKALPVAYQIAILNNHSMQLFRANIARSTIAGLIANQEVNNNNKNKESLGMVCHTFKLR